MFQDRDDAARRLADRLKAYGGMHPLVLAIPRGAVPMAKIIAEALEGELNVVLVRKLHSLEQPELALGSVDENGWVFLTESANNYHANPHYIEVERIRQMAILNQRRALYTPVCPPAVVTDRIVIVVDDGLATGATMVAALHVLRAMKPAKLICAVPVAPQDTLAKVAGMTEIVDEVFCLEVPENFRAVSLFYEHFPQISDDEVVQLLKRD